MVEHRLKGIAREINEARASLPVSVSTVATVSTVGLKNVYRMGQPAFVKSQIR
jgi:hypothetical protein